MASTKNIGVGNKPVAYACYSDKGADKLLGLARKLSKGSRFVLLARDGKGLMRRILPAYANSMIRYGEGSMRARSLQMEMLLFIAGTMNINKAIAECGARGGKFIAIADSQESFFAFRKSSGISEFRERRLSLDMDVASDVAVTELFEDR